ncbi:MAG: hypothetical protein QW341_03835 [Candidatus Bathyarchaeia archaeon]
MEWIVLIVIIVIVWLVYRRIVKRRIEDLSARALAVIRSRGGKASIDDLIVFSGLPPSKVNEVIGVLLERGLIKVVEEGGRTLYELV